MTDNFDMIRETKPADDDSQQFLTFTLGEEEYGVDIMVVREIKGWTETTRLPNSPQHMRGVMNLRGLIIPIYDLRARFTKTLTQANSSHVVIILAVQGRNIGILVDTVSDILTVQQSEVKPAPESDEEEEENYISGLISLDDRMVVLLELEKLFLNDVEQLAQENIQAE